MANPRPLAIESASDDDIRELEIIGVEARTESRFLRKHARELIEDGTAQDRRDAYKAYAESAKFERIYLECRGMVATKRQLNEAIAHERAMTGKRG